MHDPRKHALFAAGAVLFLGSAYFAVTFAERTVMDRMLRRDAEQVVQHWSDHLASRFALEGEVFQDGSRHHDVVPHQGPLRGGANLDASHFQAFNSLRQGYAAHAPALLSQSAGALSVRAAEPVVRPDAAAPALSDFEMRAFQRDRHLTLIEGWAIYSSLGDVVASGGTLAPGRPGMGERERGVQEPGKRAEASPSGLAAALAAPSAEWTTSGDRGRASVAVSLVKDGAPVGAIRTDLDQARIRELIGRTLDNLSIATAAIVLLAAAIGIFIVARQARARRHTQEELRKRDAELTRKNACLDIALENMSQGLCLFDKDKRLVICNRRYMEMYNLPPRLGEPGTPFREILEERIASGNFVEGKPESYVEERLAAVEERVPSTKLQELKGGRVVAIGHRPLPEGGWLATHEDITELQRIQAKVAHMAKHDALTDLPNRTLLRERIQWALLGGRSGGGFAVLYLDLDRFKGVNDTLGHPAGDALLIEVAHRLRACVREGDTIARFGGDEFAILQLSQNLPHDAGKLAGRICEAIRRPYEIDGHQVVIETSIGIAIAPCDGNDPDQLLRNADMALYGAKNDGRGVFRFFEPDMDARMQAHRQLETDLRMGIQSGQFDVYYQPVMDAKSQEVTGFEALVRWRHPERGMVSPDDFVPAAEETGLIIPLGEWVLRRACAEAAGWPRDYSVAVNLSPVQFKSGNVVTTVVNALATTGLSPARLELEITESVLLQDSAATLQTLHQLRALGVKIAMDDFGTGYSSLSYLRSFPFDKIKIDRSFVSELSEADGAVAILCAVAKLGASLGMVTTAEGVETAEQLERICAEGYQEIQGFFFSPPRTAEEISSLYFAPERQRHALG